MKTLTIALAAIAVCGGAVLLVAGANVLQPGASVLGSPASRLAEPLRGHGTTLTLASTSVAFPDDSATFTGGASADVVNANCTACHSVSMVLNQPPLTAKQWTAEVAKMHGDYHAPIAEADVPVIIDFLTAMSASLTSKEAGTADLRPGAIKRDEQ